VPEETVTHGTADHRFALKLLAWIVGIWLTAMAFVFDAAVLPPEASGTVIVLFPVGTETAEAVVASAAAGAKLVSTSWFDSVLVVADETPGLAGRLKEQGAIDSFKNMSFAGISFAGCIGASLPEN
jgi:hypothetical protein